MRWKVSLPNPHSEENHDYKADHIYIERENAMIAICIIITAVVLCLFAGHAPDPEWYDNQLEN